MRVDNNDHNDYIIVIERGITGSEVNSKRRSHPLYPLRGLHGDEEEEEDDDGGEGRGRESDREVCAETKG